MNKSRKLISTINKSFSSAITTSPKKLSIKLHKYLFLHLNSLDFSAVLINIIRDSPERNIDEYFQSDLEINQYLHEINEWMLNNIEILPIVLGLKRPLEGESSWEKFIKSFCEYLSYELHENNYKLVHFL